MNQLPIHHLLFISCELDGEQERNWGRLLVGPVELWLAALQVILSALFVLQRRVLHWRLLYHVQQEFLHRNAGFALSPAVTFTHSVVWLSPCIDFSSVDDM